MIITAIMAATALLENPESISAGSNIPVHPKESMLNTAATSMRTSSKTRKITVMHKITSTVSISAFIAYPPSVTRYGSFYLTSNQIYEKLLRINKKIIGYRVWQQNVILFQILLTQFFEYRHVFQHLPFLIYDYIAPAKGLPDGRALAHIVGQVEYDVVHLLLEVRVFHHIQGLVVALQQVVEVEAQIFERAVPTG